MKTEQPMLHAPVGRLLWKNATPAVAAMFMSALYQIIDGIMVGRRLGPDALAAVTIAYPVIALLVGLAVMIGTGGNARIAVLLGRRRPVAARRVLSLLVALGCGLGVGGGILVYAFGTPLTAALGAEDAVRSLALIYLFSLTPFFAGFILSFILEQSLRNDGRGSLAGIVMASAAVLNVVLDYLFLFPLNMGIAGAALASGISMTLAATVFVIMLVRRTGTLYLVKPRLSVRLMAVIAANGSSELLSALAMGVVTLLFNRTLMRTSGSDGVAAFAVVQYLLMLSAVFLGGLAAGGQPIIGINHGAGQAHRVRATLIRMIGAGVVISLVLMVVGRAFAPAIARLFVPDHPAAVSVVSDALRLVAWSLVVMPLGTLGSAFFTALERPVPSLVVAALRSLALPLVFLVLFPKALGPVGVWLVPLGSELGSGAIAAVLIVAYFRRLRRSNVDLRKTPVPVVNPEPASVSASA